MSAGDEEDGISRSGSGAAFSEDLPEMQKYL
jgi:hypothetical protein